MFNLQVMLPDSLKGRWAHTTKVTHQDSTHKRLIHFGGVDKLTEDNEDINHPVAETTIMELGE